MKRSPPRSSSGATKTGRLEELRRLRRKLRQAKQVGTQADVCVVEREIARVRDMYDFRK